ncbi:MAG: AAA family ATPase [Candidatus Melainabacteria bacterium]|nr:AAA family ATPase [Candidatus Melainabacteria bacterium]
MWIEKITLYGFGGITNEEIEFGSADVNLIVEPNEYGKSTLAEGIWATLFDFPEHGTKAALAERETLKPWDRKAPYKAELDLVIDGRSLKVIRNFGKKEVQVIDRNTNEVITSEFLGKPDGKSDGKTDATDQVGFKLTGMTRDLFRNTCLLGQRHLDAHHVGGSTDIAPMFQAMADTATPSSTAGGAVEALQDALFNYAISGSTKRMTVEDAINELESTRADMLQQLAKMEVDHRYTAELIRELDELNNQSPPQTAEVSDSSLASEYDVARMEFKEIERKLEYLGQRYEQKLQLENDLRNIDQNSSVTSPVTATLKDLWTRKNSRQTDADRLADEIRPQQEEYERLEQDILERYRGLEALTADESNSISSLAINLYKLQQELNDLQKDHQEQTGRHLQKLMMSSQQHGVALDVLKGLSRSEIEEAKNYSSLLIMFYDQVQEEQKKIQETKFSIDDIEERRKSNRTANIGKMLGCCVACIAALLVLVFTHDVKDTPLLVIYGAVGVFLASLFAGLVLGAMIMRFKYHLKPDAEAALEEELKHKKALAAVKTKIQNLEGKLTGIAVKTGTTNKDDLIKFINEASTHEDVLSEQETRDSSLGNQEARMGKLEKDLAYFFHKAGRDSTQIDSQRAMDLSQDVAQYHKEKEALESQFQNIRTLRKQLDFLLTEIDDSAREVETVMRRAGVTIDPDNIEEQISNLLQVNTDRQTVLNEIARVEYDLSDYPEPREALSNMQFERDVLKDKIRYLTAQEPALANRPEPIPTELKAVLPWGEKPSEAAPDSSAADTLARKEALVVEIRTALNYRDEHFLETMEELANIEHELNCARRSKHAITLARDVIKKLSTETYEDWSQQLNSEADRLISQLNLDIEKLSFDRSLRLTVKLKGHDREFSSQDIVTRLSTGTREQVHWLARIILTSFLSKRQPLPIVLDEPFSEADDERFVSMMKFLISSIAPNNQVIILSCHHQRHQWLASQLNLEEKEKLTFRTRKQLGTPGAVR